MLTATDLPDDIAALKAMLLAHDEQVQRLTAQLDTRAAEIEHLKLLIAKLQRMQFGCSSEKVERQIEQLELKLEDLKAETGAAQQAEPTPAPRAASKARKPLPPHLPRDERVYQPEHQACPDCGGALSHLGEDIAEQLEYVPASFRVIPTCAPSWHAPAATPSSRPQRRAARWSAVSPDLACWHMYWWPSMPTICRCIAKA